MNSFLRKLFCYYGVEFLEFRRQWDHIEITVNYRKISTISRTRR